MTTKKRLAAYGMAAAAAVGGGIGGLAIGLGLTGGPAGGPTILTAASGPAADPAAPGAPAGPARVDRLAVAAQAIGISAADLRTALQGGTSIAQVAKDHNVDEQKVIDALVAAETTALDQAVKDGKLTQAQADERKANLAARTKDEVEHVGLGGPGGPGGPGRRGPGGPGAPGGYDHDDIAIAAQAIGISAADLRTAVQGGTSIAQVAKDHNVDEQKVIDALVAAETTAIDQAVKDGKLTQAQADQAKAGLAAHEKEEVEQAGPGGPGGPGDHRGPGGPGGARVDRLGVAAQAIGISAADLRTALQGGTSIAQVAKDHNVDEQKVIDALVGAETTAIDQAVKDGKLTQAQADQAKAGLAAHAKEEVEQAGLRGPGGPGDHGPGGPRGPRGPGGRPAVAPTGGAAPAPGVVN